MCEEWGLSDETRASSKIAASSYRPVVIQCIITAAIVVADSQQCRSICRQRRHVRRHSDDQWAGLPYAGQLYAGLERWIGAVIIARVGCELHRSYLEYSE